MKLFGFEIRKAPQQKTIEMGQAEFDMIVNPFGGNDRHSNTRPRLNPLQEGFGDGAAKYRSSAITVPELYALGDASDTVRTINLAIRREIFKNGLGIRERFTLKCTDCNKEFDSAVDQCDECGGARLREPRVSEKQLLEQWIGCANDNKQSLVQVSKAIEKDLDIIDDGFMVCVKDYYFGPDGDISVRVPVEFVRADTKRFEIIADKTGRPGYNDAGDKIMVCPRHRDRYVKSTGQDRCGQCNVLLQQAFYRDRMTDQDVYYIDGEVKHESKYDPTLTYGVSPILSVYTKVVTLINMDTYMMKYYSKQRPPRGLLAVKTSNQESVEKAWAWMLDEWKENPHQIPPLIIEDQQGQQKGSFIEFIDFMRSLDEMQFTEVREEFRRTIGAVYAVMPIFQGDMKGAGGLNNEGLQVTVTNRAITEGQKPFNEGFYPWVCEQLNVGDYEIYVLPNEAEDEAKKVELWGKKVANAKAMQDLGFTITLNEDEEFEYDPVEEPVNSVADKQADQQAQSQQAMMPPPGLPPEPASDGMTGDPGPQDFGQPSPPAPLGKRRRK